MPTDVHMPGLARKLLQETGYCDLVWGLPRAGAIAALLAIGFASGILVSLVVVCVKLIRARRASRPAPSIDSSLPLPDAGLPPNEGGVAPRSASKRGLFSRGLSPVGPLGAGVAATMAAASPVRRRTAPATRGGSSALIPAVFVPGEGLVTTPGRRYREGSLRASSPAPLGRSPGAAGGDLSRGVSIGPLDRFLSCVSEEDDEYLRSPSAPPAPETEGEKKEEEKGAVGEEGNPFATTEEAVAAHKQALLELEAAKMGLRLVKKSEGGPAAAAAAAASEGGGAQGPRNLALKLEEALAEGAAGQGSQADPDESAA